MKALASEIRQAAEESGWSLNHICDQVGISPVQVHQWENGTKARPKTAKKVRKGLEQFGIAPTAPGFASRKVEQDVFDGIRNAHDEIVLGCIRMIAAGEGEPKDKLEAIRFLLSK